MKHSVKSIVAGFVFATAVLGAGNIFAQSDRELVIATARAITTAPSAPETIKMRAKALEWVIKTDEVKIIACGGAFGAFIDKKSKNVGPDMTAAYMIGMAAFKLENPDKVSDENAAQLAGLETALKTYELLVAEKPKFKSAPIDALLAQRTAGTLASMVAAADCGKK